MKKYLLGVFFFLAFPLIQTVLHAAPAVDQKNMCLHIKDLGIDKQTNFHAGLIRIACGLDQPGNPGIQTISSLLDKAIGNVNTITGTETYPNVTQSESTVWSSDGKTVVVNYNDSRTAPLNYSGLSVSTDAGITFTRLDPSPFASGHGTNYGDPILVFNAKQSKWFAGDLVTGCGGQGIGLWTSTDGLNWSVGACAHSGFEDDRESMWVDNNPTSPFYGRMYVSWNDFALNGTLRVAHSDDGINWLTAPSLTTAFLRNVQITGGADGSVFIAAMDEGSGGLSLRTNIMFKSTDGGNTWTSITMGSPFMGPGDITCGYFGAISPIWRHMGWGQPGVGPNGVVHYVYAGHGINAADPGDIYYTRSTDNGTTWSTPIRLNTDTGSNTQWMPSLSVSTNGDVHVYWYDRRNTTNGQNYEVWGRQSPDNGVTWLSDSPISTVLIPQPLQPDPNVVACYAGDYNYATAFGGKHYAAWTDGRVAVSGRPQQDVFYASIPIISTTFIINLNPSSYNIPAGGSAGGITTITSTGGFNSPITLACTGQPAGVSCSFSPNPATPPPDGQTTSALTLSVSSGVPQNTYTFNVQGMSGSLIQMASVSLQVTGLINVTSPIGGEIWAIGSTHPITWTSVETSGKINIDLSRNGGTSWTSLFSAIPNNGKKQWKLTAPATTQARIRVCNSSRTICGVSGANFTIQ